MSTDAIFSFSLERRRAKVLRRGSRSPPEREELSLLSRRRPADMLRDQAAAAGAGDEGARLQGHGQTRGYTVGITVI